MSSFLLSSSRDAYSGHRPSESKVNNPIRGELAWLFGHEDRYSGYGVVKIILPQVTCHPLPPSLALNTAGTMVLNLPPSPDTNRTRKLLICRSFGRFHLSSCDCYDSTHCVAHATRTFYTDQSTADTTKGLAEQQICCRTESASSSVSAPSSSSRSRRFQQVPRLKGGGRRNGGAASIRVTEHPRTGR